MKEKADWELNRHNGKMTIEINEYSDWKIVRRESISKGKNTMEQVLGIGKNDEGVWVIRGRWYRKNQ